jgi:processive 1,2-diacylglycerol beta-glucosyltransferase
LADTNPAVVVSTFPVPAGVLSALRVEQGLAIPSVVAVTDYTVHSQWMHSGVDLYLVAHSELEKAMTDRGVPQERIAVTGIPIDPRFGDAAREHLRPLGPPWRVMVMGGAYGMLPNTLDLVEALLGVPSVEVVLVAGRDVQLRLRGEALRAMPGVGDRLAVLGYTREIPTLMGRAHLLVTKGGGLTISEALAVELPLRIYRPLPGQELSNVDFLVRHGAARVFKNVPALVDEVRTMVGLAAGRLCEPPPAGLARPDSALDGAARILALAEASAHTSHVTHPPRPDSHHPWRRGGVKSTRTGSLHVKRHEVLR